MIKKDKEYENEEEIEKEIVRLKTILVTKEKLRILEENNDLPPLPEIGEEIIIEENRRGWKNMLYPWKRNKRNNKITIINETDKILTNKEREIVEKTIILVQKQMEELRKTVIETDEEKEKVIKILMEVQELIDIEDDKTGKPYNKKDYEKMTNAELITLTHDALEYALKQFKNKDEK